MPVTSLRNHKFVKYTIGDKEYEALPNTVTKTTVFYTWWKFTLMTSESCDPCFSRATTTCGDGCHDGNTRRVSSG
jgi:hypothetical protein